METPVAKIHPKLDCLGKGVDCRKPSDTWLDELDHADKVRDLAPDNIEVHPVTKRRRETRNKSTERRIDAGGCIIIKPHPSIQGGAGFEHNRATNRSTKYSIEIITTKIAKMRKDARKDPNVVVSRDGTHYTKYEEKLSQFILEHMETNGASTKDLKGANSVAKLGSYLQHASAKGKLEHDIWQKITNACHSFMTKKMPYTQYVSSISLGAVRVEARELQDSSNNTTGGFQIKGLDIAEASLKAGRQLVNEVKITSNWTRGEIDSSETVKVEEVIEIILEPVSNLINTRELEAIMKRLLQLYSPGPQYGPFRISCRERDKEIYWQVDNENVYGTTDASEASSFYIKRKGDRFCHMTHKTSKLQTEMYLMIKRPFDAARPLVLVQAPKRKEDTCFILMDTMKNQVKIPQTEDEWKSGFYIKLPAGGLPMLGRYMHPQRFVSVKKCEGGTESTTSKYSTASCATPDMKDNITLFYFKPVVNVRNNRVVLDEGVPLDTAFIKAPVEDTDDTAAPKGDNAKGSVGAVPSSSRPRASKS